jgi:hypothetical protein
MIGLYHIVGKGNFEDVAIQSGVGRASKNSLGFGCAFLDADLSGSMDLIAVNGHIDDTVRNVRFGVGYAQPPQIFLNDGKAHFREIAQSVGGDFNVPKVGRGLAYGDFDRDGDLDVLMTSNNGRAYLFRNDVNNGNRSIRFYLTGTKSNRDGIGAIVRVTAGGVTQSRMVKSGSSYLSQSEMPVTFGVGRRDQVEEVVVQWPSGKSESYKNLSSGKSYQLIEDKGLRPMDAR